MKGKRGIRFSSFDPKKCRNTDWPPANASWPMRRFWVVYLILLPGLAYFVVFRYWPLYLAQIAFKDFQPLLGVEGSPWNGFQNFEYFFKSYYFSELITNTLIISLAKLIFGIPPAIILAIAISEARAFTPIARLTQTMSYLPHFLSWIVVLGVLLGVPDWVSQTNQTLKADGLL